MKIPSILSLSLVLTNLISLYFILGFLLGVPTADYCQIVKSAYISYRLQIYMLYITWLFNLYFIFYLLIREKFKE